VFQTPRHNRGSFDEAAGWTPRFAEEYSVFNSTPGNLRGGHAPFADFVTPFTPNAPSAGQKRPLSAGGIAAEIATHVTHFSPNPSIPLAPVEPAKRLASAPGPLTFSPGASQTSEFDALTSPQERSAKKARRVSVKDLEVQTATPPPSARKGERKLAPKLQADTMQQEQGYGHQEFIGTPQQPHMATFVTTPNDMFGYPMSAPAAAPAFADSRFWETDPNMTGMEMDFSAAGADVFQTPTPTQRSMAAMDWGRSTQMFQDPSTVAQQGHDGVQAIQQERPAAPKQMMPNLDTTPTNATVFDGSFSTPMADPFGIVNPSPGGGVDPGLLFSRPPSSSMDAPAYPAVPQPPSSSAPAAPQASENSQGVGVPIAPARGTLRRSVSVKELGPTKQMDRTAASSPIKASHRPGLARSFSENKGKRPVGRPSLPVLAPAIKPASQQMSGNPGIAASRSASHGRPSGRMSPSKAHQRLSSLTSIPEVAARTRTSVKFTIDANGRARVETTVAVDDDPLPPSAARRRKQRETLRSGRWDSSDDDDASETDDEPIIIPSRNTSFALPDPIKATGSRGPFHTSQHSISERSTTSSFATLPLESSQADDLSEAETVMNDSSKGGSGDAASELEKLRQSRQRRGKAKLAVGGGAGNMPRARFASTGGSFGAGAPSYPAHTNISPTTLTDTSLPTPSTDSRSHGGGGMRCVCNRAEQRDGDGFMVQW
jgi:hypothetical protein